jgi:hypothetical protein
MYDRADIANQHILQFLKSSLVVFPMVGCLKDDHSKVLSPYLCALPTALLGRE